MAQLSLITDLSPSLVRLIQHEYALLRALPQTEAEIRPGGEGSWSPKEELGHLIDSATNNHVRFTRALIEPEFRGPSYAQNDWVRAHRYQEMPWLTIVEFWFHYNGFIAALLKRVPEEKLLTTCFVGSGAGVSLQFLVEDYVLHIQHHIDHLLCREVVTAYPALRGHRGRRDATKIGSLLKKKQIHHAPELLFDFLQICSLKPD